ncbi:hypothetical protein BDP27DRAFT_1427966 [Rhodocollybia butyracea]|uniref:Uncharacterized protein n=1 Tax=Rhodocollybia butyracea TaxID=206335 RepID=A0A9P5U292_9AGAR|nr:hypothetical protein BDP27DRAFT_1427966 [Rhodocollybia butyracea]
MSEKEEWEEPNDPNPESGESLIRQVAVLTFIKSAFRTIIIQGAVELNERQDRARVVQLSAHVKTDISLSRSIFTTPNLLTETAYSPGCRQ